MTRLNRNISNHGIHGLHEFRLSLHMLKHHMVKTIVFINQHILPNHNFKTTICAWSRKAISRTTRSWTACLWALCFPHEPVYKNNYFWTMFSQTICSQTTYLLTNYHESVKLKYVTKDFNRSITGDFSQDGAVYILLLSDAIIGLHYNSHNCANVVILSK